MHKENGTKERTKLLIYNTFQELLEEKTLAQISISEIVERSRISRQTFYRHFDDIYDLLLWTFNYLATGCTLFDKTRDFEKSSIVSFTNMKKQPKLYRQLFLNDKDNLFSNRFLRSKIDYSRKQIGEKHVDDNVSFAIELYWSGYLHMIKKWIASGMKEPPENMGKYAYESLPTLLKTFYH